MNATPLIAVIDDDPGMRLAVDALIRSIDYRVAVFSSAEEFLASDLMGKATCVVSDVNMGGMSGIELISELHGRSSNIRPPPVILLSAFATEKMLQVSIGAGALCLLKKPFDPEVLIESIERAIACEVA